MENQLNDLGKKEWLKFSKSWFIHSPKPRDKTKLLHPASFPESLAMDFIRFFTKKGQLVLDPFLGSGSTLLACIELERSGVGVEVVKKWVDVAMKRLEIPLSQRKGMEKFNKILGKDVKEIMIKVIHGDSRKLTEIWKEHNLPPADYCFTSPPYWKLLKKPYRPKKGLQVGYSEDPNDIGNIEDYESFLKAQKQIFNQVYEVTRNGGYLTVVTTNVFFDDRLYPLAFDTLRTLSENPCGWIPKEEKIYLQNDRRLLSLCVFKEWRANRAHHYCLNFRKQI